MPCPDARQPGKVMKEKKKTMPGSAKKSLSWKPSSMSAK